MWASCGKLVGTSIIVLTLQAGADARAETAAIGHLGEPARDESGAALAAAAPFDLSRPPIDRALDLPGAADGAASIPAAEPADIGALPAAIDTDAKAQGLDTAPERAPSKAAGPVSATAIAAALRARLEAGAEPETTRRDVLSARKEREAVAAFYAGRDFAPLWYEAAEPVVAVDSVVARLERAAEDGLDLAGFQPPAATLDTAEAIAAADIALTDAVVAYGRQASGSRIDPGRISRLIGVRPEVADAAVVLAIVAAAGERAGDALQGFNPPHAGYAALRQRLASLQRHRGPSARSNSIPAGPVLRVGMRDPRVPLIRSRLSLDEPDADPTASLYDTKLAAAVASFQKANGLKGSGHLTAQTVAVLSGHGPSRLEAEIIANMERWRWMPRDLGESHIAVNIPDFEAAVVANGTVVQRHRVVVGKEKTPTPVFSEEMRYLIVNPYWNLPPSIIRNEYGSDPDRLRRHGYQVFSRNGKLAARQAPGEKNALGRIKFMFPNDYSVYIHDTPSRALFDEARRAFSHGCVRIDEPFRFAETVLGKSWTESRLKRLIGGKERYLTLPQALPVHIQYFTAFVDDSGELQTREDIYGYSRRVRAALGLEG